MHADGWQTRSCEVRGGQSMCVAYLENSVVANYHHAKWRMLAMY